MPLKASAYRTLNIHPSISTATVLKWYFQEDDHNTNMADKRLSFSVPLSPEICNKITQTLKDLKQ